MFEEIKEGDVVSIKLKNGQILEDIVERKDRDGSITFKKIGPRYKNGMKFIDWLSKEDVVEVKIIASKKETDKGDFNEVELLTENIKLLQNMLEKALKILKEKLPEEYKEIEAQIMLVVEEDSVKTIDSMNKKELLELAKTLNIELPESVKKSEILEAIKKHQEAKINDENNTTCETSNCEETGTAEA